MNDGDKHACTRLPDPAVRAVDPRARSIEGKIERLRKRVKEASQSDWRSIVNGVLDLLAEEL